MTAAKAKVETQVYRVYIKAAPEVIWNAITDKEWTAKYGYACPAEFDLRAGGAFRITANPAMKQHGAPDVIIDGEVIESDPPRKLVQTWRALFSPDIAAEGFTKLTWEIVPQPSGSCMVTVTHELENAPALAKIVSGQDQSAGGGWAWILSDLKTLLETGSAIGM